MSTDHRRLARTLGLLLAVTLASAPGRAQSSRAERAQVPAAQQKPAPEHRSFPAGNRLGVQAAVRELGGTLSARRLHGPEILLDVPVEVDNALALAVTPDGRRVLATGLFTQNVAAHDVATGDLVWATDVGAAPYGLAVGSDVAVVACALSGEAVILDAATGAIRHRVPLGGEPVTVSLSADGALAFVGAIPSVGVYVVDTATGAVRTTIPAEVAITGGSFYFLSNRATLNFTPARVSADGTRLVHYGFSGVRTYDTATGGLLASADAPPAVVFGLDLAANGSTALVLTVDGDTFTPRGWFYAVESGQLTPLALGSPSPSIPSGAITTDGSRAVVSAGGQTLTVAPGVPAQPVGAGGRVVPLGQNRAAVTRTASTALVDLTTGTTLRSTGTRVPVDLAATSTDGATVAGSDLLESAVVLDLRPAGTGRTIPLGAAPEFDVPRFVAVSPNGALAAVTLYSSGQVVLIDLATRTLARAADSPMAHPQGLAFLSDDQLLIVGGDAQEQGVIVRMDVSSGAVLETIRPGGGSLRSVLLSETATPMRAFVHDPLLERVTIYDVRSDRLYPVASPPILGGIISSGLADTKPYLAISRDGRLVVGLGPFENEIVVYRVPTGASTTLPVSTTLFDVALSADGARALVTGSDRRVYLLDLTGTPSILAERTLSRDVGPVVFDADEGVFVVADPFTSPSTIVRLDPNTAAVLGSTDVTAPIFTEGLTWSSETGLVASGRSVNGGGAILTEAGYVAIAGGPAQTALSRTRREAVVAVPGPDVLAVVAAGTVAADPAPAPAAVRLTPLQNPSRTGVRVRLDGPPVASVRVEVVDALGRVVARLREGGYAGGAQTLAWPDAPAGSYWVRVAGTATVAQITVLR